MRSLVYVSRGKIELREVPEPQLAGPFDVKVRLYGSGVCGTDHKIVSGQLAAAEGVALGHEGVGTVTEVAAGVSTLAPGDRVVVNPTQSCGNCRACRLGHGCYCSNFDSHQVGFTLPGTFCDYYVGHERYLYRVPSAMSWRTASLIEPLGCSLNSMLKARVSPGDTVLVIGSGAIGLLCQLISRRLASLTVATETAEFRRAFAASVADRALHPRELTGTAVDELTGGRGFDVVVDAVGNQLETALAVVAKGGRVVPMGYDDRFTARVKPVHLIDFGISIVGAVPLHDAIGTALDFAAGLPDLERLVTVEVPLERFEEAFDQTMSADPITGEPRAVTAVKALITC
jgi:(R,R)-butanediol dehydrogenase / meso-butanediol dehydrogenase / diacetyl reductase